MICPLLFTYAMQCSLNLNQSGKFSNRFEPGAVRRSLDLPNLSGSETYPVLWGLSTAKLTLGLEYDAQRSEVSLSGSRLPQSKAPWQKRKSDKQSFQVIKQTSW
jgi:hypothetical protein